VTERTRRIDALNEQAASMRDRDPQRAYRLSRQAERHARACGYRAGLATSLLNMAAHELWRANYRRAGELSRNALEIFEELEDAPGRAQALNTLGLCHTRIGEFQTALALHGEGLKLFRELGDVRGEGKALVYRGGALEALGEHDRARGVLEDALAMFSSIEDRDGIAQACLLLGIVYKKIGDFGKALEHGLSALEQMRALGDSRGESAALNNIGTVYGDLDDSAKALEHYTQALAISRRTSNRSFESMLLSNIGEVYESQGDLNQAREHHLAALATEVELGDRRGQGITFSDLGRIYGKLGDLEESASAHLNALRIAEEVGDRQLKAIALLRQGQTRERLGDLMEAQERLQASLKVAIEVNDPSVIVEARLGLARLLLEKDREPAVRYLAEALALAERLTRPYLISAASLALSEAHESQGEHEAALGHYKRHVELEAARTSEESSRRTRGLLIQFEVEKMRRESELQKAHNRELTAANRRLEAANAQSQMLLAKLRRQALALEHLSRHDSLTGLKNRRYFEERLAEEFEQRNRHEYSLCLAIVDVDSFKQVNDTYSHITGDNVLRVVARVLEEAVRSTDFCARYGGEEFVLLLRHTPLEAGIVVCERVREAVETYPWGALSPGLGVTLSIGLADAQGVEGPDQLLKVADNRLYMAKREGKNRVVAGGDFPPAAE
jgi:diguanylate cyclase (GGDEF)-like protein